MKLNTLGPRQNGRHFPDDIFKWIFLNENVWISIHISLKFVPRGPINNMSTLVQVMAWRRLGDKPLSEPMMVRLLMHICVTRPQWVNSLWPSDAVWHHKPCSTLVKLIMTWCLMAPSHYLNQCWLINGEVFRHSPESKFKEILQISILEIILNIINSKITATSPRDQGVKFTFFHWQTSPFVNSRL